MGYKSFSKWLITEKRDIFGFEKDHQISKKNVRDELPIKQFNIEVLMNYLSKFDVNDKQPDVKFINELHWGSGPGALRCWFGTGLNVIIERQSTDLQGQPRWFCHRVYQIDQTGYGGNEESVGQEILEVVKEIDKKPMETPRHYYEEMENLVVAMTNKMKRAARDIFIYEGIRKLDSNQYIIRFSLRGGGVETLSQKRVLENQTYVTFSPDTGMIRVFNFNLESPVGVAAKWEIKENDTDWFFAPNQSRDEIAETISNVMHWY